MEEGGELDVTVVLAFAFDFGYAIDLERARPLLQGSSARGNRRGRRPAEALRYRPEPLRVNLDVSGLALPGSPRVVEPPRGELALFDFGAVSLSIAFRLRTTPEELLDLGADLADMAALTAAARLVLEPWLERIKPVVIEYEPSELSEEYVVFAFGEVGPGWLEGRREWVARLVRLESGPLSEQEIAEATRLRMSYAPNDVVVLDWAAGLIADQEWSDTLQVIEFANVQLLEFRYIDDRLDDRLELAYGVIRPERGGKARRARFPWRLHADAVRSVRELEVEATSLFERTDNALKLIGDQYLSRVFGLASQRFHLGEWQQSIRRKLDTVGDVYDLLVQQASGARLEFLEVVVIVLIALEIVLALVRH
jgi:hypothetical protein